MPETTTINVELRKDVGKGASRRMRREGKVPAVIYGGHKDPVALTLQQHELLRATENEAFYASILEIKIDEKTTQQAVVRDLQRHPFKPIIMHIDFLRVSSKEVLKMLVPVHFVGEEDSPAGRASGVVIQHLITEIEISALPKDLPEFVSIDLSEMAAGEAVMLSDIQLPEGVEILALAAGEENDVQLASAIHIKEDQGTGAAAAAEAEAALAEGELGEGAVLVEEDDDELAETSDEDASDKEEKSE
ncbi:MAG: 50S ribosomal protein L25/general stress protein Ctc [Xanthomonadales bacterium]